MSATGNPVRNALNHFRRLAHSLEDAAGQIQVGDLVAGAYIINLPGFAFIKDELEGAAIVPHKKPIPHILPLGVERDFLAFD